MDIYRFGPAKTLVVAGTSVGFDAGDLKPTSGINQGVQVEIAIIQSMGPLYMETGGGAATTASYPMSTNDILEIRGYENIKDLRFIRNVNSTSIVWLPGYR